MKRGRSLAAASNSATSIERHALRGRRCFGFGTYSLSEPWRTLRWHSACD